LRRTSPAVNFRITDEVNLGQGSETDKFNDDIAANHLAQAPSVRAAAPRPKRSLNRFQRGSMKLNWSCRGLWADRRLRPSHRRRRSDRGEDTDIAPVPIAAEGAVNCQIIVTEPFSAKVPNGHAAAKMKNAGSESIGIPRACRSRSFAKILAGKRACHMLLHDLADRRRDLLPTPSYPISRDRGDPNGSSNQVGAWELRFSTKILRPPIWRTPWVDSRDLFSGDFAWDHIGRRQTMFDLLSAADQPGAATCLTSRPHLGWTTDCRPWMRTADIAEVHKPALTKSVRAYFLRTFKAPRALRPLQRGNCEPRGGS